MAKLFDEVLSGTSTTADLLVTFSRDSRDTASDTASALQTDGPRHPQAPLVVASAGALSSSGSTHVASGGGVVTGGEYVLSPRPTSLACASFSAIGSPVRYTATNLGEFTPCNPHLHTAASIRCHTLILRTQPMLLQAMLQSRVTREGSGATGPGGASVGGSPGPEPLGLGSIEVDAATAGGSPRKGSTDDQCDDEDRGSAAAQRPVRPLELFGSGDSLTPKSTGLPQDAAHDIGGSVSVCSDTASACGVGSSPPPTVRFAPPEQMCESTQRDIEVIVDDEPEVFVEMLKFVYLNTCHVDHSNIKALMVIADKYAIEDLIKFCLQWMQDHFTASLFYSFLTFKLTSARSRELLMQSLLFALRSRRNFVLMTGDVDAKWDQLSVSFVEALLGSDELPVVSEAEVLELLARWARGSLGRPCGPAASGAAAAACAAEVSVAPSAAFYEGVAPVFPKGVDSGVLQKRSCTKDSGTSPEAANSDNESGGGGSTDAFAIRRRGSRQKPKPAGTMSASQQREVMLRLLGTFRKSDMLVRIADIEPVLEILQLTSLFSSKPARETSTQDPGFTIYRGVTVNAPTSIGELSQRNLVQEPWRGPSVTLGARDFLQQVDGFKLRRVSDGSLIKFPRLWVKIKCTSWMHREKRAVKNFSTASHPRHSMSVPLGGEITSGTGETLPSSLTLPMAPVNESSTAPAFRLQAQDDWEIGRKLSSSRPGSAMPITDNEKIDHKVVCAVVSGQMQHGIRIGQRDRCSIYDIEELYGQCDEVSLGGEASEVEFELQLTVQAPNHCGICRCGLAVHTAGVPDRGAMEPLLEMVFDVSVEEPLHFNISSCHFDSNSTYSVSLNWVLRPGLRGSV